MLTQRIDLIDEQGDLFFADLERYRLLIAVAGEQGGKSVLGSLWLHHQLDEWKPQPANFLICAPTYKVLEQSTRPTFFKLVTKNLGSYNAQDDVLRLKTGGAVYFRSGTDPDSVIGIPDCVAAWIDEAGKCSLGFFQNIQGRVARMQGTVMITSTPYASNWLAKLCKEAEVRRDILYRRWSSAKNPTYPKEEYERLKNILPAHVFKMRVEGLHDKATGLIFDGWDDLNWVDAPAMDLQGAKYFGGIDWGSNHPFAVTVRAVNEQGQCYGVSLFKGSGLSVTQQLDLIQAKHTQFGVIHWRCGHDRPEMIQELAGRGIPAVNYFEGQPNYREVEPGNMKLAELIKTKKYRVCRGIQYADALEDEYSTYHWDQDDSGELVGKQKPVDENNDLISAERYCTIGTLPYLTTPKDVENVPLGYYDKKDYWKPGGAKKSIDAY